MEKFVRYFPTRIFPAKLFPIKRKIHVTCILMKKNLAEPAATALPKDCEFRVMDGKDIDLIAAHEESFGESIYRNRCRNGDICFGVKQNGEIVAYNWIRFNKCCVYCGYSRGISFLPLAGHQAFTYDLYTYKKFRNRGFGTLLKKQILRELNRRGIEEVFSVITEGNDQSFKIHFKLDFDAVAMIDAFRLLGWTKTFVTNKEEIPFLLDWVRDFKRTHDIISS